MTRQEPSLDKSNPRYDTELFTVRMWREVLDDHFEWRGKVIHSGSHTECYFREWEALTEFIQQTISDENEVHRISLPKS
jgi:hypothetical protein